MDKQIELYRSPDGKIEVQINLTKDTIWLDAHLIAEIFNVNRPAIVKHIQNIYKSGELIENTTCSIMEQVAADGKNRKMKLSPR
jgi:hypothetical protein